MHKTMIFYGLNINFVCAGHGRHLLEGSGAKESQDQGMVALGCSPPPLTKSWQPPCHILVKEEIRKNIFWK